MKIPTGLHLGIYVAVLLAVAGVGAYATRVKHKADGYDAAVAALKVAEQKLVAARASMEAVNKLAEGYQRELKDIRSRPVGEPVRLCKPVRAPAAPAAPTRGDGPRGPTRLVSGGDGADHPQGPRYGPDIRPDLNAYAAKRAERDAQARLLQGYVRELLEVCGG